MEQNGYLVSIIIGIYVAVANLLVLRYMRKDQLKRYPAFKNREDTVPNNVGCRALGENVQSFVAQNNYFRDDIQSDQILLLKRNYFWPSTCYTLRRDHVAYIECKIIHAHRCKIVIQHDDPNLDTPIRLIMLTAFENIQPMVEHYSWHYALDRYRWG